MPQRHAESPEVVAERLELLRKAFGYSTQIAFVQAIDNGMTISRWNNYLGCHNRIPVPEALNLVHKFGVSLDWIYRGDVSALSNTLLQKLENTVRTDAKQT